MNKIKLRKLESRKSRGVGRSHSIKYIIHTYVIYIWNMLKKAFPSSHTRFKSLAQITLSIFLIFFFLLNTFLKMSYAETNCKILWSWWIRSWDDILSFTGHVRKSPFHRPSATVRNVCILSKLFVYWSILRTQLYDITKEKKRKRGQGNVHDRRLKERKKIENKTMLKKQGLKTLLFILVYVDQLF